MNVKPFAEKNAVKVFALAMQFSQHLTTESMNILVNQFMQDSSTIKEEFDDIQPQQEISVTIGPDGLHQQIENIGGLVCRKTKDGKVLWEMIVNKGGLVITCRDYSRWAPVLKNYLAYMEEVFKLLERKITQITLEYLDEFIILNHENEWKKELFRESCEYLTPHACKSEDFWHVHQGSFHVLDDDKKLLDTVKINYFREVYNNNNDVVHKVNIVTQHILQLEDIIEYNIDTLKSLFQDIHDHSKNLFYVIIHDEMIARFEQGDS